MPRKPRIEFEGALYHVMSRGNHGEVVFTEDDDRNRWLDTLGQACEKTGWRVHAYVILDNHYHLLLETPEANLVSGMKWFQGTFTQRINARRRLRGHLFQGRYKALVIDPDEKGYFRTVANYIHMNPVRAGLIARLPGALRQYRWSSYPIYLSRQKQRPRWLDASRLLWSLGLTDRTRDRNRFEKYVETLVLEWHSNPGNRNLEKEWKAIRRGWFLGGETFRDYLLELVEDVLKGKQKDSFSGEAARTHDEKGAEKWLEYGLKALNVKKEELPNLRKNAPEKAATAWLIRTRSTASNRWISKQLVMGHPSNVSAFMKKVRDAKSGEFLRCRERLIRTLKSKD
jgi:REP element-mobilizing transposase RayT